MLRREHWCYVSFRFPDDFLLSRIFIWCTGATATWDALKIHGCDCDVHYHEFPDGVSGDVSDWIGYDCSLRTCPTGDSPYNALTSVSEVGYLSFPVCGWF